jgi:glycosyltransferase involved in cell wall biosynthesis
MDPQADLAVSTKPAKLLYVIDTLKVGGAQLHLLDIATGLDKRRFEPLVCTLGPPTELSSRLAQSGFAVRTLGLRNIYGSAALKELPRLQRWIRESQVDLVHTYLPSSNVYGAVAAWLAGVSNVITSRRDMGFSRSWRLAILEQTVVNPFVCRVVTVCDAVSRCASRDWFLDSRKIVTIYNGVDPEPMRSLDPPDSAMIRRDLGVPAGTQVVTIVGSLTPVKAHSVFLAAASRVLAAGREAFFVVVGGGQLRSVLEGVVDELGIAQHVHFTGEVSKRRVGEILCATDIGVLTSDSEGMSNALLDFMRHEKPVVATNVGGNPEVVEDGQTGILFPVRDSSALSLALQGLLADTDRAAEMGRRGRRRIAAVFSRERMLRSLESLYDSLLGIEYSQSNQSIAQSLIEKPLNEDPGS